MKHFTEFLDQREDTEARKALCEFENEVFQIVEEKWKGKKTHPSEGMSKKEKGKEVKEAKKGKDMFKKGKNFAKIAKKAAKRYGSKEKGDKVAGAIFWKKARGGKKMSESEYQDFTDDLLVMLEDCLDDVLYSLNEGYKPGVASYIHSTLKKGVRQGKSYEELRDEIADEHKGWKLSKYDYEEAKRKHGSDKKEDSENKKEEDSED